MASARKRASRSSSTRTAATRARRKKTHRAKTAARGSTGRTRAARTGRTRARKSSSRTGKRWSARVMQTSDAMDLEQGVFKKRSARQVALSLKRSAESSRRRKSPPFRSAMSMLNFEINRGGKNLSAERKRVLNQAKNELRKLYHRDAAR